MSDTNADTTAGAGADAGGDAGAGWGADAGADAADPTSSGRAPFPHARPFDAHNQRLVGHTHPADWHNPKPQGRYHLVVVGGGPAGLVVAAGAAGLGARVALVEKHLLGGDCLNVGCVPSKALIRCARARADVADAARFGVAVRGGVDVDFGAVMERVRRIRADLSHHDSAERFAGLGVDVFLGDGRFTGPDRFEIGGATLRFARACVATGARAVVPPIDGLADAGFLTNETVFSLTQRPSRIAILGAGPIGCELAQSFARLGSEVVLIEVDRQILIREDRDAAELVEKALLQDGVQLQLESKLVRVEREVAGANGTRGRLLHLQTPEGPRKLAADQILIGVGRAPNVEDLGLDVAGVACDKGGITVDDRLRTTNKKIFAAGDVCSPYKFTHAADAMARIVIQNALFFGRGKASALTIPWCTYTDPEVAHVGLYPHEAEERGIAIDTHRIEISAVDRAALDGEDAGFLKVHCHAGKDRIVGATLVSRHAGESISEITLAMTSGAGLKGIGSTIHPYPTQAEAIKKAADAYNRTRLTPFAQKVLRFLLALCR